MTDEEHRSTPHDLLGEDDVAKAVRAVLIKIPLGPPGNTASTGCSLNQTLSSLHPEILSQLRIFFSGFGLALDQEFQCCGNWSVLPAPRSLSTSSFEIHTPLSISRIASIPCELPAVLPEARCSSTRFTPSTPSCPQIV
jgi:hypothetical protein